MPKKTEDTSRQASAASEWKPPDAYLNVEAAASKPTITRKKRATRTATKVALDDSDDDGPPKKASAPAMAMPPKVAKPPS